jgi:CRISPR-associated protein Cas2
MSHYVAAYDISHPGRRSRVARVLLAYGRRVQRSVYEIQLEPEDLPELQRLVGMHLRRADLFDLYPVDRRDPRRRVRWQRPPVLRESVVLL